MQKAASRPTGHRRDPWPAIESFQAGSDREGSFRSLFDTYEPALRRYFARKGLAPELARDLTQETFLRVFRGLDGYRPEARFETWLYRIATTTWLKHRRAATAGKRAGEEVSIELTQGEEPLATAGRQLDRVLAEERRRALERAIRELPAKMRRCLELRIYQERSCREIAGALEVSLATVKAHLWQARGKLRRELAAYA